MALMVWGIGRAFHSAICGSNERRRIHGQFIPEWIAGATVTFGSVALCIHGPVPNVPVPPSAACSTFGILAGLVLGNVHGWIRLATHTPNALDELASVARETGNPYQPPMQASLAANNRVIHSEPTIAIQGNGERSPSEQ